MPSQLELLKGSLERAQARANGPDDPFVKGLKAQIAMHEKPPAENPMASREQFSVRMGSTPGELETEEADGARSGALRRLKARHQSQALLAQTRDLSK